MKTVYLNEGETIILRVQATLQFRVSWHHGYLVLTNRRLFFMRVTKNIFEADLNEIVEVRIVKRAWLLGVRVKQLCIIFDCGRGLGRVDIALKEPEKWSDKMKESMTLALAERWGYNGTNTVSTSNTE